MAANSVVSDLIWSKFEHSFKMLSASFKRIGPGAIARSVAMSLGNQEAPGSILASGTSFREDLGMKLFIRPFFLFR